MPRYINSKNIVPSIIATLCLATSGAIWILLPLIFASVSLERPSSTADSLTWWAIRGYIDDPIGINRRFSKNEATAVSTRLTPDWQLIASGGAQEINIGTTPDEYTPLNIEVVSPTSLATASPKLLIGYLPPVLRQGDCVISARILHKTKLSQSSIGSKLVWNSGVCTIVAILKNDFNGFIGRADIWMPWDSAIGTMLPTTVSQDESHETHMYWLFVTGNNSSKPDELEALLSNVTLPRSYIGGSFNATMKIIKGAVFDESAQRDAFTRVRAFSFFALLSLTLLISVALVIFADREDREKATTELKWLLGARFWRLVYDTTGIIFKTALIALLPTYAIVVFVMAIISAEPTLASFFSNQQPQLSDWLRGFLGLIATAASLTVFLALRTSWRVHLLDSGRRKKTRNAPPHVTASLLMVLAIISSWMSFYQILSTSARLNSTAGILLDEATVLQPRFASDWFFSGARINTISLSEVAGDESAPVGFSDIMPGTAGQGVLTATDIGGVSCTVPIQHIKTAGHFFEVLHASLVAGERQRHATEVVVDFRILARCSMKPQDVLNKLFRFSDGSEARITGVSTPIDYALGSEGTLPIWGVLPENNIALNTIFRKGTPGIGRVSGLIQSMEPGIEEFRETSLRQIHSTVHASELRLLLAVIALSFILALASLAGIVSSIHTWMRRRMRHTAIRYAIGAPPLSLIARDAISTIPIIIAASVMAIVLIYMIGPQLALSEFSPKRAIYVLLACIFLIALIVSALVAWRSFTLTRNRVLTKIVTSPE